MWICDPVFAALEPVQTLHRQWAETPEPYQPREDLMHRHMLVRREFSARKGEKLSLSITADDYYMLYVNGRLIGMGPAQAYPDRQMVNEYDLSVHLAEGRNVIAAHVYYMGTFTRAWQSGDQRQGLWMKLTNGDGRVVLESDRGCRVCLPSGWRHRGVICGHRTQFIEEVFAKEIPEKWNALDFDDSDWQPAHENPADDHVLVPQPTPVVDFYDEYPAMLERRGDVWFADMGREVTGTVQLTACAKNGGTLEFRMGEELNADGTVRHQLRCQCDYRMWWHLSGREKDEVDFVDYMAFRYFEIADPGETIDPKSIRVRVRHYPMPADVGVFESESALANGMFEICRRGVQLGAQETFVDCPTREKGQYMGDGTITAHAHLLLTGDKRMYRKMLYDFAAGASVCPGLMAVAPGNEMQEIADFSCQFPEQILTYYELTGDIETVREMMPVVDGLEDFFDSKRNADGLIENLTEKWNLVDWPDNLRDGYDFPLTQPIGPGVHNVINAFCYGLKRDADRLRALLGLPLRNSAGAMLAAFRKTFRKEDGLFRDAENTEHTALHSVVMPLYYGMVAGEDLPAVIECIRGKGICCGVYMAYFLLKGLARCGEYDLMNELLFSEGEHSWANMLREGATTCWEAWGKEQKWNTSLCHPWAGAPVILFFEDVAGVRPAAPGFEEIVQTPHAPERLGDMRMTIGTVKGPLTVERRRDEWSMRWE